MVTLLKLLTMAGIGPRRKVAEAIKLTKDNQTLVLNVAFNYGGRDEILQAVKKIINNGHDGEDLNAEEFSKFLYTADSPDPDLIIRTSGEYRSSNFMIWQGAYSEWYFTPTYWPDFNRDELLKALVEFDQRDRRYGEVKD